MRSAQGAGEGAAVTAPAPKYRYVYAIPLRHSIVRGNVMARTVQAVRDALAVQYGSDAAEAARVEISTVVSIGTNCEGIET